MAAINFILKILSEIILVLITTKEMRFFLSAMTGEGGTFPISKTLVLNGKALIVEGRGKFANAKGEVDYEGYFNAANANDVQYTVWID